MASHDGLPHLWLNPRSGKWYIQWHRQGRTFRKTTKERKKAAAERHLREFLRQHESVHVDASRMTFHVALEEWHAVKSQPRYGLGAKTIREYRILIRQLKEVSTPSLRLLDVTARDVEYMLAELERRHRLAPSSMKKKIVQISGVFRFHQRQRSIDRNPVDGIERPRVRHEPTPEITRKQYDDLIARTERMRDEAETVHDRRHAELLLDFMQVLWLSGHRRIELCRLTWKDIDLRQCTWWIRSPEKKGGVRIEPIHLKLVPILQRLRKDARAGPFNLNVVENA